MRVDGSDTTRRSSAGPWSNGRNWVARWQVGRSIKNGEKLGQDYLSRNLPVVEKQLAKAGVRLAALLDEVVK